MSEALPEDKAWLDTGEIGTGGEDFIVGNKAGLEHLREQIDKAISEGSGTFPSNVATSFIGIQCTEKMPPAMPETFKDRVAKYGCLGLAAILIGLMIVGIETVIHWIFKS